MQSLQGHQAIELTPSPSTGGVIGENIPLIDTFQLALKENSDFYASRKGKKFTSPLFGLIRRLKSHPALRDLPAGEAFSRLSKECNVDWASTFPDVAIPSLEFVTAWEQVNLPMGLSLWHFIKERVTTEPLTLRRQSLCEGYASYLGIAFQLQRLTPTKDILLPVKQISEMLTELMKKTVSAQNVSYYCRLAKQDGYLRLTGAASKPAAKAARYRFSLSRFSRSGVETVDADFISTEGCFFSHGNDGSCGIAGFEGLSGKGVSSRSSVLAHAMPSAETSKAENATKEQQNNNGDGRPIAPHSISDILKGVTPSKPKAVKAMSLLSVWQSIMHSKCGWQEKLSDNDADKLVEFSRRTDKYGPLIVDFVLRNWPGFGRYAIGPDKRYPTSPDVGFFFAYQAKAFHFWSMHDLSETETDALIKASEGSRFSFEELEARYAIGDDALFQTVAEALKYQGLLIEETKGWSIGKMHFGSLAELEEKYIHDEQFAVDLRCLLIAI
ncbi:MAG TPA: hypothetical protein VKB79_06885 [Bryobacteraceae bacterium]|nr:hypothetical protein [Bryobacteraceae bacterium]